MAAESMSAAPILAALKKKGTARNVAGMARYGIVVANGRIFGVSVADIRALAKPHRKNHALASALWKTGWYEARMMVAFVADPAKVTPAEMDQWARDFDNWAICDTLCFHLFDKTPHAWAKIHAWARRREEFVRRAGFALLASVALHDKAAPDAPFVKALALVERCATDERNFVKKAVSWALRGIGKRSPALRKKARAVATRLAASDDATARWIGKDALRDWK